jgi:hypothetical protein
MTDFVRVKDRDTGHEFSLPVALVTTEEVLPDRPAVDRNGAPLPAKHSLPLADLPTRDGDREIVTLPEGDSRTVITTWPEFDSTAVDVAVKAIVSAQQTETIPDLVIARLLLEALGVDDLDDVLDQITDDQGRFIPLDVQRSDTLAAAQDRGEA